MRRGTVLESSEEDFDLLFSVHVKGPWLLLKLAQPLLRKRAMIVQMCSRHAREVDLDPGLYSLSKRCELELAELVERTYPHYTVKILCPGPVDTAMARFEVNRAQLRRKEREMRSPEELARLIVRLFKDDRRTRLLYDESTKHYRLV
jgi:NAD(P)-dependent dehydrogenase (short-subunit alcohol dehydrogenase family)